MWDPERHGAVHEQRFDGGFLACYVNEVEDWAYSFSCLGNLGNDVALDGCQRR